MEDEQGVKCTNLETPFVEDSDLGMDVEVAGSCNGLVVIYDNNDDLFLWNLATREYKILPSTSLPSSLPDKRGDRRWSRLGFGIDPITNDYKVVRIWNYNLTTDNPTYKVEVLCLSDTSCRPKSESWKIIDAVPPIFTSVSDYAYLNGKYYWCTETPNGWDGAPGNIVWFDMGTEVFGFIELPILFRDPYWNKLGVLKESLAMIRRAYQVGKKYMYQIWIMDDGISWTKYATVGPFKHCELPLGFWKNEELVVLNYWSDCKLFSYDVKRHVIKKLTEGLFFDMYLPLHIYNESLVSIA